MTMGARMTFEEWWEKVGSGITPFLDEDFESHAKRVADVAWHTAIPKHVYVQDNDDLKSTACAKCGLDLRNPIHARATD